MNIKITSVSKRPEKLSRAPAAIYVITQADIERSGARNIPDLLRMVPGVDVAQIDANRWAISIRGFNDLYSDKVLVLIDGRTVYTPVYSGVYWDQIDVPLNDIERIEVIRGPGATVWGANAVNGVINIISKSAKDTQGVSATLGAGSAETTDDEVQYGGAIGKKGYYRVFGHYANYGSLNNAVNLSDLDGWQLWHSGFRADLNPAGENAVTVEGDVYSTDAGGLSTTGLIPSSLNGQVYDDKLTNSGGSILGKWNHSFSARSSTALQFYDSAYSRLDSGFPEKLNTADLEFQNHVSLGSRQDIVWGLGYRDNSDSLGRGIFVFFNPAQKNYSLFSAFVQDEIRLADSLRLTVGVREEHNAFTGFENEPGARLSWAINGNQTLWLAASKAVRQPGRLDTGLQANAAVLPLPGGLTGDITISGNSGFRDEQVRDYEIGYRAMATPKVSVDLTSFYSFYRDLRTIDPVSEFFALTPPPPHLNILWMWTNDMHGQDYGAEAALNWSVTPRWKLSGGYSWLKMNLHLNPNSQDTTSLAEERESPEHQFNIRSYLNISRRVSFDSALYYVASLPSYQVSAYTSADARLAWQIAKPLQVSITGQNLLSPEHFEFGSAYQVFASQAGRSVFGQIKLSF
ncbi:MAG: TonB-dependent receptor plug domain-containing protein [Terriglobia bacterium]